MSKAKSTTTKTTKTPKVVEPKVVEPEEIALDRTDILYVENQMLKDENESYRHKIRTMILKIEKEKLHDYFVDKYEVNLDKFTFSITGGNKLIISPLSPK